MWCLEWLRKHQDCTRISIQSVQNQVFQDQIFLIDGHGELLQTQTRHPKADAADAITLLESKNYCFFIFCSDVVFTDVINDEWKMGW